MADRKITELNAAAALAGTELVELIQSSDNVQATLNTLKAFFTPATLIVDLTGNAPGTLTPEPVFTDFSGTTVQASAECHWDAVEEDFVFDKAGTYRIVVRGSVFPDGGWPDNTVFGTVVGANRSCYNRVGTVGGSWDANFLPMRWSDEFYYTATEAEHLAIALYADHYATPGTAADFAMSVTIQRISP